MKRSARLVVCSSLWPGQRQQLLVWADELQAQGDALGELITASLRADELCAQLEHGDEVPAVVGDTAQLRRRLLPELLDVDPSVLSRLHVRLRWRCGVVRALELRPKLLPSSEELAEVLGALARRPVFRWLDRVSLNLADGYLEPVLTSFAADEVVARPRMIVFGPWPGHVRRLRSAPRPERMMIRMRVHAYLEHAPSWGLRWLIIDRAVQEFVWAKGEAGDRLRRLEERLAQPWSEAAARELACACWDRSERVRRRVVEVLPELPDEAAPLTLALLAQLHSEPRKRELVRSAAQIASTRPTWVEAVAHNFASEEPWAARWLADTTQHTVALRELHAKIVELDEDDQSERYPAVGLQRALARFPKRERAPMRAPSSVVDVFEGRAL